MNPVLKKNFAVFPVLDWIATLAEHIPDKGEQLLRYYGYYSNVSRGKRKSYIAAPSIAAPQRRPALRECAQRPPAEIGQIDVSCSLGVLRQWANHNSDFD